MLSELRFGKWVIFFEWNCIVKCLIVFASFCWLWDFLQENMKLKKTLIMFFGTSGQIWIRCMPEIIFFQKRIPNMRFWIIYISVQILCSFGDYFFFFIFGDRWPTFLLGLPTIKKLPTPLKIQNWFDNYST